MKKWRLWKIVFYVAKTNDTLLAAAFSLVSSLQMEEEYCLCSSSRIIFKLHIKSDNKIKV